MVGQTTLEGKIKRSSPPLEKQKKNIKTKKKEEICRLG